MSLANPLHSWKMSMRAVTFPLLSQACLDTLCPELVQGFFFRKANSKCILYSLSQADANDIILLELCLFVLETSTAD